MNNRNYPDNKKLQVILKNKQGSRLVVTLRAYESGDEEGMIACIQDEYQATYFKRNFYNPEYLKQQAGSGKITFLVAQTKEGEIVGMLILKSFFPRETMCEIASQIFRKKYRGYGLAMPFFQYGLKLLRAKEYSAAYCLPVLFHNVTQRLLYRLGLRATGLVLNVFDMSQITHSYHNGRNTKHSQGIQIQALSKKNAGKLYLPREHRRFCTQVYENLQVEFCVAEEEVINKEIPPITLLSCKQDEIQSSLEIHIQQTGQNLEEQIQAIHRKYPLVGKQTANIFLNCNTPLAIWAYEKLTNMGYFFTGLKPLCSEWEYMILHHPGETPIYFQDYVLSEEFADIAGYVEKHMIKGK